MKVGGISNCGQVGRILINPLKGKAIGILRRCQCYPATKKQEPVFAVLILSFIERIAELQWLCRSKELKLNTKLSIKLVRSRPERDTIYIISTMAGLYLHIPFCKQRCHYCNFHFATSLRMKNEMVAALLKEMALRQNYLEGEALETIYFGGGTPSLLPEADLELLSGSDPTTL